MAFQMIYTSVKSGLVAGRSGFCTAARHREIKESLVSRIEGFSNQYDRNSSSTGRGAELPVIFTHRIATIRETSYHVLSRIADAGNDYSGRTNHIAHSLVLEPAELETLRVTPAEAILELNKRGIWRERYDEAAKFFGPEDEIDLSSFEPSVSLPATGWKTQTGCAGTAALLVDPKAAGGAGVILPDTYTPETLLELFGESALISSPDRSGLTKLWSRSFSTLIQSAEQRSEFDWCGSVYNSRVHMGLLKKNFYLVEIATGLPAPAGALADIAEGKTPEDPASSVEELEESRLSQPTATAISHPESSPVAETPLKPERPENRASTEVGTNATRITGSSSATTAIPSDLLNTDTNHRHSGNRKWLILTPVVVALAAVAVGTLLHFNPTRTAERELASLLEDGRWEAAAEKLESFPESERAKFVDNSSDFAAHVEILERYHQVITEFRSAAYKTGAFLEENRQLTAGKDPLRRLAELRESWERSLRLHPGELPGAVQIDQLHLSANEKIQGYIREKKAISQAWSDLMEMKNPAVSAGELRRQVFDLDTESSRLLEQIENIEVVTPFVEKFHRAAKVIHPTAESAEKAADQLQQLSENLGTLQAKAAGKDWEKYIASIRKRIATFEPQVKATPSLVSRPDREFETEKKPRSGEAGKTAKSRPPVPASWLLRIPADNDSISYAHIPGMIETVPEALAIAATPSFIDSPLERSKELAEINGETVMYYFTGQDTVKIFSIEKETREIRITPDFRKLFGDGFQLSWGREGNEAPDFILFGQSAGESAQPFYRLPFEKGLSIIPGENREFTLSEDSLELISQIHLPPGEVSYELFFSDSSVPVSSSGDGPEYLRMSPSKRMDQKISRLEEQVKNFSSLREISEQFESAFANLGENLFSAQDGKVKTNGLKIKSFPQKAKPPHFGLVPDEEEIETLSTDIRGSLESYIEKSGDFIEGPPFLHYLSAHLGQNLQDLGMASSKSMPQTAADTIREAFSKIRATNQWGPDEVKEAMRLLGVITATAQNFKLTSPSITKERFPTQEEAERARKRREKDYRQDQIVARFFNHWVKAFTPENLALAEQFILAGGAGSFGEAQLDELKTELKQARSERAALAETPLSDLGSFRVSARVTAPDGTATDFLLLQLSGN